MKNMLLKYDAKMFTQQEESENIRGIINREADQLHYFKVIKFQKANDWLGVLKSEENWSPRMFWYIFSYAAEKVFAEIFFLFVD